MRVIFAISALFCLALAKPSPTKGFAHQSDTITSGQDGFVKASTSVLKWLQNIDSSLDKFVAKENRSQLATRLHKLNQALSDVETAKLALIFDLKNSTGSEDEIKRLEGIVANLVAQVRNLQSSIHEVSILLREEAQKGGADCEKLLSSATGERKLWLFQLASNPELLRDPGTKADVIAKGEAAARSLREASLELAKLTKKLEQE